MPPFLSARAGDQIVAWLLLLYCDLLSSMQVLVPWGCVVAGAYLFVRHATDYAPHPPWVPSWYTSPYPINYSTLCLLPDGCSASCFCNLLQIALFISQEVASQILIPFAPEKTRDNRNDSDKWQIERQIYQKKLYFTHQKLKWNWRDPIGVLVQWKSLKLSHLLKEHFSAPRLFSVTSSLFCILPFSSCAYNSLDKSHKLYLQKNRPGIFGIRQENL